MDVSKYVGERIKEFRTFYNGGKGLSQEELATKLGVATNTVSRWEKAVYKPKLKDIDDLAKFFGKPISSFFPEENTPAPLTGLMRAAKGLHKDDVEALTQFAQIKSAQNQLRKK